MKKSIFLFPCDRICQTARVVWSQRPNGTILFRSKKEEAMTHQLTSTEYEDAYEYHGCTTISVTRRRAGSTVWRDWLIFDSVEEAAAFFHESCVPAH
jgi:hypothetical protein